MDREHINEAIDDVKNHWCAGTWDKVLQLYGDSAHDIDLADNIDYAEIYARGDLKECETFCHIAFMQKSLVDNLFDIDEHAEAQLTYITLDYWVCKLYDKFNGDTHTWLN